jgi:hypothetical protein
MDPKELRGLVEAYSEVYAPQQIDEISLKTKMSAFKKRATHDFESDSDADNYTKSGENKTDQIKANIVKKHGKKAGEHAERAAHAGIFGRKSFSMPKKPVKEGFDLYDLILSHLIDEGYADTQEAANAIMANMSEDWRESIVEARMDPRGRPASGPMNVYANPKKPSQAHLDAVKAYDAAQKKKTPEQKQKELDAYRNRKMYS